MNLLELKEKIDELVLQGHGDKEVKVTEPDNDVNLWDITSISLDTTLGINEQNKLYEKEVVVLYSGSDE